MPSYANLLAIRTAFPAKRLTNEELSPIVDWPAEKIEHKTGIASRNVLGKDETAVDLAERACRELLETPGVSKDEIDFLVLCTQSPDFFLPTSACILQDRLGLPLKLGAFDFNLGCSGFVYGLGMVKGLIETGQARNAILVTADAYTKYIHPKDRSVRTIFGDGAAATLVTATESDRPGLDSFVYGTDGRGAKNLIVNTGAMKHARTAKSAVEHKDHSGNIRTGDNLFMSGRAIYEFTLTSVPALVNETLAKSGLSLEEIDLFVFHQANAYMLEGLREQIGIPREKFVIRMREFGNTVSATIPIAIEEVRKEGGLKAGQKVMLVGFGVGYSWSAAIWTVPATIL